LHTDLVRRHTSIQKLARGGNRNLHIHLDSIDIAAPNLVVGKAVLLLDDIATSGNSMIACQQRLLEAGASEVLGLVIGQTTHD
jgi:predicted amidophosphoribosyltransferase